MPFLPSEPDNESMRACIGVNDLFSDIPPSVRLSCPPLTPPPRGDAEVERAVLGTVGANRPVVSFRGGGVYRHHVPAVVSSIVSRGEFATSYTPYQPEVSQGMLQSLYEYQCLMAELVGLPVVNASMYDWSTALAEAMLLCVRVTHRDAFAVPDTMSPQRRAVLGTYAAAAGVDIIDITHHPETGRWTSSILPPFSGALVRASISNRPRILASLRSMSLTWQLLPMIPAPFCA
jgi:glycine dehydrogenase subunit 1